jgi:hypothetical protein
MLTAFVKKTQKTPTPVHRDRASAHAGDRAMKTIPFAEVKVRMLANAEVKRELDAMKEGYFTPTAGGRRTA